MIRPSRNIMLRFGKMGHPCLKLSDTERTECEMRVMFTLPGMVLGQLVGHDHVTVATQPDGPRACISLGVNPSPQKHKPTCDHYK